MGVYEDGSPKIDGACVLPPLLDKPTYPVTDMSSADMRCRTSNIVGNTAPYHVKAGSSLSLIWNVSEKSPLTGKIITGACSFYMAKQESKGAGAVWFLIQQSGYDSKNWCTGTMQKNGGTYDVSIPANIASGTYYLRSEISDINKANILDLPTFSQTPQFYVDCLTLRVSGGTSSTSPSMISIPWAGKGPGLINLDNDNDPTTGIYSALNGIVDV